MVIRQGGAGSPAANGRVLTRPYGVHLLRVLTVYFTDVFGTSQAPYPTILCKAVRRYVASVVPYGCFVKSLRDADEQCSSLRKGHICFACGHDFHQRFGGSKPPPYGVHLLRLRRTGGTPVGGMPEGQGEIPLLGEMSAQRTKGSAVFAEEAVSGEEVGGEITQPHRYETLSDSSR